MSHTDPGRGPPLTSPATGSTPLAALVLVHGFPLDSSIWRGQEALAQQLRLLTCDLPGAAGSAPPEQPTIEAYARHVIDLMDRAGLHRATLCGLSMGGYILFEIWRQAPERVAALILSDTRAEADSPEARQGRRESIAKVKSGARSEVTGALLERLLAPSTRGRSDVVQHLRTMMQGWPDEGLVAALRAMHDRPDSLPTLPTINVPALVLVGDQDALTPPAVARVMRDAIPKATLREIPDAGHLAPFEQPEVFNAALLEFMRSNSTGES